MDLFTSGHHEIVKLSTKKDGGGGGVLYSYHLRSMQLDGMESFHQLGIFLVNHSQVRWSSPDNYCACQGR